MQQELLKFSKFTSSQVTFEEGWEVETLNFEEVEMKSYQVLAND